MDLVSFVTFVLWLLVYAGMGAGCYLFYQSCKRAEQSKYERPQW